MWRLRARGRYPEYWPQFSLLPLPCSLPDGFAVLPIKGVMCIFLFLGSGFGPVTSSPVEWEDSRASSETRPKTCAFSRVCVCTSAIIIRRTCSGQFTGPRKRMRVMWDRATLSGTHARSVDLLPTRTFLRINYCFLKPLCFGVICYAAPLWQ